MQAKLFDLWDQIEAKQRSSPEIDEGMFLPQRTEGIEVAVKR